jgi:uncharacterized protein involved in exopolysaccharide biosynthesis
MFDPKPVKIDLDKIMYNIKSFFSIYFRKTKLNTIIIVGALFTGSIWSYFQKPNFRAICSFVLEEKSNSASNLSNIASQFGVDLGALSGGSNSLFAGDNIIEIMSSNLVIEEVLLEKFDNRDLLANKYIQSVGLRKKFGWSKVLSGVSFSIHHFSEPRQLIKDSILHELAIQIKKENLTIERLNKKGTIFKVQLESHDKYFAEIFTKKLVEKTILLYTGIKTKNICLNINKLQSRADSLRRVVNSKAFQSYSSAVLNPNEVYKSSQTNIEINQRDKIVAFELYTEVMKNLEASKMSLMSETPIIQIIDSPEQPLRDTNLTALFIILISFLVGVFVSLISAYIRYDFI